MDEKTHPSHTHIYIPHIHRILAIASRSNYQQPTNYQLTTFCGAIELFCFQSSSRKTYTHNYKYTFLPIYISIHFTITSMNGGGSQEDLYDEFGNYIGPDLASSDEESSDDDDDASDATEAIGVGVAAPANQIVLHEDKVHYPSASTIYGPNVTT
eukprot:116327_1